MGLLRQPRDNLLVASIKQMGEGKSWRAGKIHLSAQLTDSLDQQRLRPCPRRSDRRGHAGGSASAHYNIVAPIKTYHVNSSYIRFS